MQHTTHTIQEAKAGYANHKLIIIILSKSQSFEEMKLYFFLIIINKDNNGLLSFQF